MDYFKLFGVLLQLKPFKQPFDPFVSVASETFLPVFFHHVNSCDQTPLNNSSKSQ